MEESEWRNPVCAVYSEYDLQARINSYITLARFRAPVPYEIRSHIMNDWAMKVKNG